MKVMTIDPGDHIGIIYLLEKKDCPTLIVGRTIEGNNRNSKLWNIMNLYEPEVVVFEQFALRQSAAAKLIGNKFITCEVIGVIKLYCQLKNIKMIELQPSTKEYCGISSSPKDPAYLTIHLLNSEKITEHVRDAYRLYKYYKLFKEKEVK